MSARKNPFPYFIRIITDHVSTFLSPIHHSFSPNSIASSFFYFYKINVYRLDNMPWLQCISHTTRKLNIIYLLLLFPNTRHSPPHNRHSSEPGFESERHKHPVHSRQHHRRDNSPHFIPPRYKPTQPANNDDVSIKRTFSIVPHHPHKATQPYHSYRAE